jgi:hypothetical protein
MIGRKSPPIRQAYPINNNFLINWWITGREIFRTRTEQYNHDGSDLSKMERIFWFWLCQSHLNRSKEPIGMCLSSGVSQDCNISIIIFSLPGIFPFKCVPL